MRAHLENNDCSIVAGDLTAADELIKRIRKLRWIGMEEEAQALEYAARRSSHFGPALNGPPDTD